MASARDAHSARWTPLLLTAAAMCCLLAAVLGWQGAPAGVGQAGWGQAALAGQTQCGDPVPGRSGVSFHVCAVAEKEAENGKPGKAGVPVWALKLLADAGFSAIPRVPARPSIPRRALRSHLSQAPPARA